MLAVVTGATGCLGLNLTKRLINENYEVIGLGRNEIFGKLVTQLGAKFIVVDLKEQARLKKIASNADVIFHCAALSSPWGSYTDFYQSNVIGTKNIIEATSANSLLIHVSTPSIYFDFTEKHDIKEDDLLPKKAANYYVRTKLLAENLVDHAFDKKKMQTITIRPRAIFGPYDRAIIPRLLHFSKKGDLPIIGTGKNIVDVTYVDNVVESLLLATRAGSNIYGKKYNITNDEPIALITILSMIFNALQKPFRTKYISYRYADTMAYFLEKIYRIFSLKSEPLMTRYSAGVLALGQTLNIDAAKHDLKYKPIISIEQGIDKFAKWYLAL